MVSCALGGSLFCEVSMRCVNPHLPQLCFSAARDVQNPLKHSPPATFQRSSDMKFTSKPDVGECREAGLGGDVMLGTSDAAQGWFGWSVFLSHDGATPGASDPVFSY